MEVCVHGWVGLALMCEGDPQGRVSTERWLPPEKIKSRYFEQFTDCMVLKLTVYIRNVISFSYKPKTFLAKFSILAYIPLKIGYSELGHDYDVTVTSCLRCWYLFWYVWKEETPSYLPVSGVFIFKFTEGVGNHPSLGRRVTKRFGKTRVILVHRAVSSTSYT